MTIDLIFFEASIFSNLSSSVLIFIISSIGTYAVLRHRIKALEAEVATLKALQTDDKKDTNERIKETNGKVEMLKDTLTAKISRMDLTLTEVHTIIKAKL